MMNIKKLISSSLQAAGIIAVSVGLVIGNNVTNTFELAITTELCPEIVDEEVMQSSSVGGQAMSSLVMEEGAVLLRNDANTLPLSKDIKKVNVFGWKSIEWHYSNGGSSASGCIRPEDGDVNKNVDLIKALNMYGVQTNTELQEMYNAYFTPNDTAGAPNSGNLTTITRLVEPSINNSAYYTPALLQNAKNFSDTAFVVIGRLAGENWNCSTSSPKKDGANKTVEPEKHYLEITKEEEELLTYVGANYENTIVILNTGNVMELGFLETIPGLDACMFVGYTGTRAANVIPSLIYGDVSPSGHLTDTYAYDLWTNPSNILHSPLPYSDFNKSNYIDLLENIYIGYKWYETADSVGYWDNTTYNGYENVVQYPFGHGLSYTTFDWEVSNFNIQPGDAFTQNDKITFDVTVTNTGTVPGKEVVQIYVTPPYTPGGIEKSSVNLTAFVKTHEIDPGKSEKLSVEVLPYDFASYDCYDLNNNNNTGYELDAGEYIVSLRTNSHDVKDVTYNKTFGAGNFKFNIEETQLIKNDPVTGQPVDNLFTGEDSIDTIPLDSKTADYDPQIPWLTRAGFSTLESITTYANTARKVHPAAKWLNVDSAHLQARAIEWDNATVDEFGNPVNNQPTTWGAKNGLSLTKNGILTALGEQLGENFDDPQWEPLLDQLSIDDVYTLVNQYYGTKKIDSIGKIALADYDGPAQIKGFRGTPRGVGFPVMSLNACTWNLRLAYEYGKAFGDSMVGVGVYGVWGWAMDNHRSAFMGRWNESPSEDPVLSGKYIAQCVRGLNTRGRYCFLKHFPYYVTGWNHNQWNKLATCVFDTEQGMRETTLKAYRYAFVDGGALGVMTSYEGIGAEHSETTGALLLGVLRGEWGFKGAITTDYISNYSKAGTQAPQAVTEEFVRNGGDLSMASNLTPTNWTHNSRASNRFQNQLKLVAKHILWSWLHGEYNARYYAANPDTEDTYSSSTSIASWVWWKPVLYTFNVAAVFGLVFWAEMIVLSYVLPKKKKVKEVNTETDIGGKSDE